MESNERESNRPTNGRNDGYAFYEPTIFHEQLNTAIPHDAVQSNASIPGHATNEYHGRTRGTTEPKGKATIIHTTNDGSYAKKGLYAASLGEATAMSKTTIIGHSRSKWYSDLPQTS
jgi:hypothetical protein